MPAPIPRRPTRAADEGPSGPLSILLSCPKCGAPFQADDTTVTVTCAHCTSLLILAAPDRDEVYVTEEVTRGKEDIRGIAIRYRVSAERAEIVARFSDRDGNPPSEMFVQARLAAFEQRLRDSVEVLDAHRVQVPYWHLTGSIVQAALARRGDGPKLVRLRAWDVEHTVPAYDTGRADLRDRGLRLARSRVRPLVARDLDAKGPFLPFVPLGAGSFREIDKWKGRDLERGLQPITRQGAYCRARRMLVYRPYWLARLSIEGALVWYLLDGTFDGIAGYPDEAETRALLRLAIRDPLGSAGESYRRVVIAASRCPDCGHEAHLDPSAHVVICASCHLALEPRPEGIRVVPSSHAHAGTPGLDDDYLPFWRFEFRLEASGAPAATRLEDYARVLFPQGPPPGFAPRGEHLWVPAFRLLGTEVGDETFQGLVEWIHRAGLDVQDSKIPLGGRCLTWPASLDVEEAREAGAFVPFALHGKPSAARLNTMLVTRAVQKAKLTLSNPRLVLVPFRRGKDEALLAPGTSLRVPLLVLRGGPELEAQRATVHKAQGAMNAREPA